MIPEAGNFLLCLALGWSILLSVYPLWGVKRNDTRLMASAGPLSWALFLTTSASFLALIYAFVTNDFTLVYVVSNSNTELPVWYRVAASWGAHEGSLLLWVLLMALWVFLLTLMEVYERSTHRHGLLKGLWKLPRSHWGMVLGHLGLAVTVVGIAFSQNYSVERDVRMKAGDSIDIHQYHFVFRDVHEIAGANYRGGVGIIEVTRNGKPEATLHAEKRFYNSNRSMMTEAAIDGGFTRDLYAALGEALEDGSWAVRLYYKPFVRWIWAGGLLMTLGGVCSMFDSRYRSRRKIPEVT